MYIYTCSRCIKFVRQQLGNCWLRVLTSGTPSTQARRGSWLLEAPYCGGGKDN